MANLNQFEKQQYLCLETFRKTGQGVKTPVWFVQEDSALYVWTIASSGKIKRIKNNKKVAIVPSKVDGTPLGDWVECTATADSSDTAIEHVKNLFTKKYGLQFQLFSMAGSLRKSERTTIKIEF